MPEKALNLVLECDCPQLDSQVPSERRIEVTVQAAPSEAAARRSPLNLALVLDRSGSMSGDKLTCVQQAACHVLDQLGPRDRVTIVAYDDEIHLLSPSAAVSSEFRTRMKGYINMLRPGGSTDLGGGWLRGAEEVAANLKPGTVSRVLLLTDGLANRGITDLEELAQHARELSKRGVSTSTFGVGLDFQEHLLESMATQGGGHYYFIDHPRAIPGFFAQELGELLTVVAQETQLTVEIPAGVGVELLGDLPHEKSPDRMRIFLYDLFAGEKRAFYLKILAPAGQVGDALSVGVSLTYSSSAGPLESLGQTADFAYVQDASSAVRNPGVLERAAEVEMSAAASRALALERVGQRQEAASVMSQALACAAPAMSYDMACEFEEQTEQIGAGLTETLRKTLHDLAYKRRNTRK